MGSFYREPAQYLWPIVYYDFQLHAGLHYRSLVTPGDARNVCYFLFNQRMNQDHHLKFKEGNYCPTNAALIHRDFSNLLAQYKRAVYTKWMYVALVNPQQEIDWSVLAAPTNRNTDASETKQPG